MICKHVLPFCVLSFHILGTVLLHTKQFNFYKVQRERNIHLFSAALCIHGCFLFVPRLETCSLGVSGRRSNQPSCLARASKWFLKIVHLTCLVVLSRRVDPEVKPPVLFLYLAQYSVHRGYLPARWRGGEKAEKMLWSLRRCADIRCQLQRSQNKGWVLASGVRMTWEWLLFSALFNLDWTRILFTYRILFYVTQITRLGLKKCIGRVEGLGERGAGIKKDTLVVTK